MRSGIFGLLMVTLAACATSTGASDSNNPIGGGKGDGWTASTLPHCVGRSFTPPPREGWNHLSSRIAATIGSPRHFAQDVIAPPGDGVVSGKFAYGSVWKDLEDERIAAFVDDCDDWRPIGEASTDEDGKVSFAIGDGLSIGEHEVRLVARGDQSQAVASIWVLPVGTHLAITDVDGTLTTGDTELFHEILDGSYVPEAYDGAADLTWAHDSIRHVVVYLTGRPYWLLGITRDWLGVEGFAPGPLHVAPSNGDILPTDGSVGAYKKAWLDELIAAGYVLDVAYGNATTDIHAYADAGVPADATWIIGSHAGEEGTNDPGPDWTARADEVGALPLVDQPF